MKKHWRLSFAGLGFCLCLFAGQSHAEEEKVLNLYNWSDYFAPDTLSEFQKETGIKVRYDAYDSDETLQSKLMTGDSGYDLVWPTNDFMAKQIQAGAFRKLDKSKLPNLRNLDPALLKLMAQSDPGNQYGVPYMWGTVGVGYDRAKVSAILGKDMPADSMDLLFNPAIASRIAAHCGIGLQDSASTVLPLALRYVGRDPVNPTALDYAVAQTMLLKARPNIRLFVDSASANELIDGELCVMVGYSGAINLAAQKARELDHKRDVVYDIPSIGTLMWFDAMVIPKTAKHPDNAHAFINYILRPDVVAKISNATRYANANQGALRLMDPALINNPNIYPDEQKKRTLFTPVAEAPATARLEGRIWLGLKASKP
ncbi:spermidine/putrescine ABC transporter substrate-binding protein PotF [Paraburkholderia ginsengiterrae]|uniref:Putrescine-binding periplasmic protein n=1 Tax=Paraburkholderia ginsengiterrae TaxID=1462993 RepID=A0A1A9N0X4_9BURK|nr:polyamine ABC transporter substrate-binding protein [Paraburkholderia ginsengiterrae]OAJ55148.1 spermidine/putrescine ABC transporter substrate-binding protein PotF [Paraburkholderia ginsengiterrae]OAJ55590.1 spermidine/putrescine ABC transporter substrate-binding protein PotF [Paraburkholderia ginsengiterrae]